MRRSYRPASSANASASPPWARSISSASESGIGNSFRDSRLSALRYQPIDVSLEIWLAGTPELFLESSIVRDSRRVRCRPLRGLAGLYLSDPGAYAPGF